MKLGSKTAAKSGAKKFTYKPMSADYLQSRKNQSLGSRDSFVSPDVKFFTPQAGDNVIRILPPTWEDAEGYGYECFVHYGIGADRNGYLCLNKHKESLDEECPVCVERAKADAEGDPDYAKELRISKRIGVWLIDRAKEGEGPKFWAMPASLERNMAAVAINKKTGEVLQFADPDDGYDFNFTKQGKEIQTKYEGAMFDRDPTPLSSDSDAAEQWISYIVEHPIPSILVFHDAEKIAAQFKGAAEGGDKEPEPKFKGKSPLKPKFALKKPVAEPEPEPAVELPSWEEVHALKSLDEIATLCQEKEVDLATAPEFSSIEEAQDWACEQLGVDNVEKPKAKKGGLKLGSKKAEEPETADLPSWEEVHGLESLDEISVLCEAHSVDLATAPEFSSIEEAQDWACEQMGVAQEETEAPAKPNLKTSLKDKLKPKPKK